MLSKLVAKFIVLTLPPQKWYRTAFVATKCYSYILKMFKGKIKANFLMVQSLKLDNILSSIAYHDNFTSNFSIPLKLKNNKLLEKKYSNGLVICSIHVPLVLHGIRLLIEQELIPNAIIVGTAPANGHNAIIGTTVKIPTILNDSKVLLKVRGLLRRGGIIIILIDDYTNGGYSTNIFRLAERLNADVLFSLSKLQNDGNIEVYLYELPKDSVNEENSINLKVNFLDEIVKKIYN